MDRYTSTTTTTTTTITPTTTTTITPTTTRATATHTHQSMYWPPRILVTVSALGVTTPVVLWDYIGFDTGTTLMGE